MASDIGFGHEPAGLGPFGEAFWRWHSLWSVWPQIYRRKDAEQSERPLWTFMNAIGESIDKIRWGIDGFFDLVDAWRVRTTYQNNVSGFILDGIDVVDASMATLYGDKTLSTAVEGAFSDIGPGWWYRDNSGVEFEVVAVRGAYTTGYERDGIVYDDLIEIDISAHDPSAVDWSSALPSGQLFRPPGLIEFFGRMFGIEVEPLLTEMYQRLNVGRVVQLWDEKGTASGYSIHGRMKGYDIGARQLFHVSEDMAGGFANVIDGRQPFDGFVVALGDGVETQVSSDGSVGMSCSVLGYSPDYVGRVVPGSVTVRYVIERADGTEKEYFGTDVQTVYPNGTMVPSYQGAVAATIGTINYLTGEIVLSGVDQFDLSALVVRPFADRSQIRFEFIRLGKYVLAATGETFGIARFDHIQGDLIPTDMFCDQTIPVGYPNAGKTVGEALTFGASVLSVVPDPVVPHDSSSVHVVQISFPTALYTPVNAQLGDTLSPPRTAGRWLMIDANGQSVYLERVVTAVGPLNQGTYWVVGTTVPVVGVGTVRYVCESGDTCGFCLSNKVSLLFTRFDAAAFRVAMTYKNQLLSGVGAVKPAHVYVAHDEEV